MVNAVRRARIPFAAAAAALALSGCYVVASELEVRDDGAGAFEVGIEIGPELVAVFDGLSGAGARSPEAVCAALFSESGSSPADALVDGLAPGVDLVKAPEASVTDEGGCGLEAAFEWPADAFPAVTEWLSAAGIKLTRLGQHAWNFYWDDPTGTAGAGADADALFAAEPFRMRFELAMPGNPQPDDNNATDTGPAGSFIWEITVDEDAPAFLCAAGRPSTPGLEGGYEGPYDETPACVPGGYDDKPAAGADGDTGDTGTDYKSGAAEAGKAE
ncbi:MAG TPA: hypothetical protein DEP66_05165, partial [Acidimicrobiaceae bacterium]|nr:hypothetical protein [Acidimicrobiaceae bacterium]